MPQAIQFAADNPLSLPRPKKPSVRGRDIKKLDKEWKDVEKLYEFDDGWYIGWVKDPDDQATLGRIQHHCSGTHFVWTCEEKIWYFFAVFDPDDNPRSTIHAKHQPWVNKEHPRDKCPSMPDKVLERVYGHSYPTLRQIERAFKDEGLKYEPGKYCPPRFESTTYDWAISEGDYGESFKYQVGNAQSIARRPADVDPAVWDEYVRAAKAVEDNWTKNRGAIKTVGRRFKFDGKWLIVISASNKSQEAVNGSVGKKVAEWLNSTGRKEKK